MKIVILYDGAGLARLGLEQAGHECVGVELDPWKHHLSKFVGSGSCILGDALKFDTSGYAAVWASPPCQKRSDANTNQMTGDRENQKSLYREYDEMLEHALSLKNPILWVENVISKYYDNSWGQKYNAAQFMKSPIQLRSRIIGGRFKEPRVFRPYKKTYLELGKVCPAIMAAQGQGGYAPRFKRAEGFYGRKMTLEECAYHQGFEVPKEWYEIPDGFVGSINKTKSQRLGRVVKYTKSDWMVVLFEAIGNGVPVYMARAFGVQYKEANYGQETSYFITA